MKVGIIGVGMVGGAILNTIREMAPDFEVACYDKFKEIGKLEDVLDSQFIFVSVPTPTVDGLQDLSPLIDVLTNLHIAGYKNDVVVKCTVLPGTMERMSARFPSLTLIHNPEFLTERNATYDFMHQKAILIGGPVGSAVTVFYKKVCPLSQIYFCHDTKVTEAAKYLHNTFLATKVAFMNEYYDMCVGLGINYDLVAEAAQSQGIIGVSHMKVPGPDGQRGFGGACFPKDTEALATVAPSLGILRTAIVSNKARR